MDRLKERPSQNDAIIKFIAEWLQEPETRLYALEVLRNSSKAYQPLAPRVAVNLEDPNVIIKLAALRALGNMGEASRPYAKRIANKLSDSGDNILEAALIALGNMGDAARPYVNHIRFLSKHYRYSLNAQNVAREALQKILRPTDLADQTLIDKADEGKPTKSVLKPEQYPVLELIRQLQSKDYDVRNQASATLEKLDTANLLPLIPKLAELLNDQDNKEILAKLLGKIG